MNRHIMTTLALSFVLVLTLLISSLSIVSVDVFGANKTNDTALAKVWVWNTEPNLYMVTVTPSSIDLNPGNTTTVNCTAFVWDYNGWNDINYTEAIFFHQDTSSNSASDDNNNHYTTTNCSCSRVGTSFTNASCSCYFDVYYYAYNGTWECNMSIHDLGGNATERIFNFNATNNASVTINTVLGIDVPAEIDYGNLSVTETSELITANVTNWGNVPINVSVWGYGGTNASNINNLSMICELGTIPQGYQRYSIFNATAYASMLNLTNISTQLVNFSLPARTNDTQYDKDTNATYWQIKIPLSVGGYCNGTVVFEAIDNS